MLNRNIYFIIPDLKKGGAERVTCEMIKSLITKGCQITIYTECIKPLGVSSEKVNFVKMQWGNRLTTLVILFKMLLFSPRNSIIIPVLTGPIILTGTLNFLFKREVIGYEHSDIEALYLSVETRKQFVRKLSIQLSLYSIVKFVVVSNYIKNRLRKIFNLNEEQVIVANNPFEGFLKKINFDNKTNANKPAYTAYIIGRFSKEKRITEAVEYAAKSSGIDRIIVVTDAMFALKVELSNSALAKTKIIKSYEEIKDFNPTASLLINFSSVESFSLIIAEWLASKLLVFTIPTQNLIELWSEYNGCVFINERTPLTKRNIQDAFDQKNNLSKKILKETSIEETITNVFTSCK